MKQILVLLFLYGSFTNAQTWAWAKKGATTTISGDEGSSVTTDLSGNVYVGGAFGANTISFGTYTITNSSVGYSDAVLAKYDPNGVALWAVKGDGTLGEMAWSVCTDKSRNVFLAGEFQSPTLTFGTYTLTNAGNRNAFVVKYDSTGNVLWAKSSAGTGMAYGMSVSVDQTGNVFLTGTFTSSLLNFGTYTLSNTGGNDIFLTKYDANGNELWAKSALGSGNDNGNSIVTDVLGNAYLTGSYYSTVINFGTYTLTNSGGADGFLVKYDPNGNELWAKGFGGSTLDQGMSVCTNALGNVFITGDFLSNTITFGSYTLTNSLPSSDAFLVKFDSNGNVIWAQSAASSNVEWGYSVSAKGADVFFSASATNSVSFGTYTLTMPTGPDPVYIAHYDQNGNFINAKGLASGGDDRDAICVDDFCNVYIGGDFYTSPFVVGTTTLTLPGIGAENIFVAKLMFTCLVDDISNIIADNSIIIYPNPTSNTLYVSSQENNLEKSQIEITNYLGQTVLKTEFKNQIDVPQLSNGFYFLKLKTDSGQEIIKKVIISK